MNKSTFLIKKMDCPSEEQMIRMKLQEFPSVKSLQFDIPQRRLIVYYDGEVINIEQAISDLNLDSGLVETEENVHFEAAVSATKEKKVLIAVLLINFLLFALEMVTGVISKSMGLVADSLDMLADSIIYGLSLYAVGHSLKRKKQIAKIGGIFQFNLAILGFAEVIRRFLGFEELPVFETMIVISIIALIGNTISLLLLQKTRDSGVHMKASWIFTSNDVIANIGVIVAGIMVHYTASNRPDLIIGSIVFLLVGRGAIRIYNLSK